MELVDWIVLSATLLFIVGYGIWKTKGNNSVEEYIKGGNSSKWWTIGLSVMATQASAITFLSTPGQAFHSGMGFVQFYIGLPIAMVIICLVFIPLYHKLKVFTAYEYLEQRFDGKTRMLTAFLFLVQRGLAAGITIYAPAIVLSTVLGWDLITLNILIGVLVILYTVSGGTKAVSVTQKQQMAVIFAGMFVAFYVILDKLPEGVDFSRALDIAGASDKMNILDFSWDLNNRYTVWTGILGGTFLMLSYFGTDQSQVQRYLSGKSSRESQLGLIFNGLLKVPMQFFILLVGIMVFVFYQFNSSPLHFNPKAEQAVRVSKHRAAYEKLGEEHKSIERQKKTLLTASLTPEVKASLKRLNARDAELKAEAKTLIKQADDTVVLNDKDYVFIQFILKYLPTGLIGLLLAVILSAAMSSTASELNALASTTAIDLYKRNVSRDYDEAHYVKVTKLLTFGWGILAIVVACVADLFDNLIQLVNIIGSLFYGNVLGIFLLAFFVKFTRGNAVFVAAIITQFAIFILYKIDYFSFLWLNAVGCIIVMVLAVFIQALMEGRQGSLVE